MASCFRCIRTILTGPKGPKQYWNARARMTFRRAERRKQTFKKQISQCPAQADESHFKVWPRQRWVDIHFEAEEVIDWMHRDSVCSRDSVRRSEPTRVPTGTEFAPVLRHRLH